MRVASLAALLTLAGCTSHAPVWVPTDADQALLEVDALFPKTAAAATTLEPVDLLAIDADIQAFVHQFVDLHAPVAGRFQQLMSAIGDSSRFAAQYDSRRTLTAIETFYSRRGNCLSFTTLFIAMARAAGIDAAYQLVDMPPVWEADAGMLIQNKHINVLVRDETGKPLGVVDFNLIEAQPRAKRSVVGDDYALALHHANLSVESLRDNQPRHALAQLARAIQLSPQQADLWVNLAALHNRFGKPASAKRAFRNALAIKPRHASALTGLARIARTEDDQKLAANFEARIKKTERDNPYYHAAVAQKAFARGALDDALSAVNQAIRKAPRTGQFYDLKSSIQSALGDHTGAAKSAKRARRYQPDLPTMTYDQKGLEG